MKHTMITFSLHRKGVVLVALGWLLLGTLLTTAGYLAGLRRGRDEGAGDVSRGGLGSPNAPAAAAPAGAPPAGAPPATVALVQPPAVTAPALPSVPALPALPVAPALPAAPAVPALPAAPAAVSAPAAAPAAAVAAPPAAVLAAPPAPVAAPLVPAAPEGAFTLRVGVFATPEEAKAFVQELAARGLQATVAQLPTSAAGILQTVRVGSYGTRREAAAAAGELARRMRLSPVVVVMVDEGPPPGSPGSRASLDGPAGARLQ